MNYIYGEIKKINPPDEILVVVRNIGYWIVTYKINNFLVNDNVELYLYNIFVNNKYYYIGAHSYCHYKIIKKLLDIKGIGIKKAINIFNNTEIDKIYELLCEK